MTGVAYDSVETWRLYSAEGSIKQRMRPNVGMAQQMARDVMSSSWWRMLPYRPQVRFEIDDHVDSDGMTTSGIRPEDGEFLPTSWLLELHEQRATERSVLHELAHVMAPRLERNADGSIGFVSYHGPGFAGPYVEMLQRFSRREDPAPLFEAMADFEVHVPGPAEWRERQAASLALERGVLAGDEPEPVRKPPLLGSIVKTSREERGWHRLSSRAGSARASRLSAVSRTRSLCPEDQVTPRWLFESRSCWIPTRSSWSTCNQQGRHTVVETPEATSSAACR